MDIAAIGVIPDDLTPIVDAERFGFGAQSANVEGGVGPTAGAD